MKLVGLALAVALVAPLTASATPREQTVLICHATHSKQRAWVPTRVPVSSVRTRLRHGDVMPANGKCP
ncbi:MAG: hypothetical protein QOH13_2690 [Thermoleophilaceae bacterium]|jgi:hypothetical protein|nr:hypothetical protein [Thermoleophilaceae bacterium]